MPNQAQEGVIQTLAKISGTVVRARGLLNTKLLSKSAPRCYVKGIKGNSHLVNFFCTEVAEGNHPHWDAEWEYDCIKYRTRDEFVGLKFLVYDGQEFLGGADFDISELTAYRTHSEELELTGVVFQKVKGQAPKKARLWITCSVHKEFLPRFGRPREMLMQSMKSFSRVASICGRIVRARGLAGIPSRSMIYRSSPICWVRCYMSSGKVIQIYRTRCYQDDVVNPEWNETFEFDFDDFGPDNDQPIMLIFDILGSAGKHIVHYDAIWEACHHLGTAMIPVSAIKDERAFAKGEARHRVPLLGECQLIEKRLDREGNIVSEEKALEEEEDEKEEKISRKVKKESWQEMFDRVRNMDMPQISFFGSKRAKEFFHLTTELFAYRELKEMPHSELLDEEINVEEGDSRGAEDDELRHYFEQARSSDGERVKKLTITGEERITTIYGCVNEATDLVSADIAGKSDPYVIVEALTKSGKKEFVYRTRVIDNNLNPQWKEAFYWQVPPDPDNPKIPVALSKLVFSIYDSDESEMLEKLQDDEDDFLGQSTVDIAFMRNEDWLAEDIPLLGCKERPGGYKSTGGFRRYSAISIEVRVERRVMRIVDPVHDFDAELLRIPRHHESRPMHPPEFKGYRDWSQVQAPSCSGVVARTAQQVLSLRDNNKLLDVAKENAKQTGKWLESRQIKPFVAPLVPSSQPRPSSSSGMGELEKMKREEKTVRRNWKALRQNWDEKLHQAQADMRSLDHVNRLPPMRRTGSLPMMQSRFGDNYEQFIHDPFEEQARRARKWIPPDFDSDSRCGDLVRHHFKKKPLLHEYTQRRDVQSTTL